MKKIKKVSIICFYNDDNQILLQERGDYSKNGEEWAFFGGGIEEGESPENAFHREAKEELGLDMSLFDYRYLGEYIFEFPERIAYWNIFIIKTTLKQDDFTVYEGAGAKYFSLEDARKLKFPSNPDIYIDIVEKFIMENK